MYVCITSQDETQRKPEDVCQLLAQHACIVRNKRCLLAYVKYRVDELLKLRCVVWDTYTYICMYVLYDCDVILYVRV